jgi:hypothetical protein
LGPGAQGDGALFGAEKRVSLKPKILADPGAVEFARYAAGIYRPVRYPHFDIAKTFAIAMDRVVRANADGSLDYGGQRWIAAAPLRFERQDGAGYLTFQKDGGRRVRFMEGSAERIAWFESGGAAAAFYFGFVILSITALFIRRRDPVARPLHWMGGVVLIHGVAWLGSVLWADPQRLILGPPWYLRCSPAFGAVVPVVWIYLAVATVRMTAKGKSGVFLPVVSACFAAAFALYLPFIHYWRPTIPALP